MPGDVAAEGAGCGRGRVGHQWSSLRCDGADWRRPCRLEAVFSCLFRSSATVSVSHSILRLSVRPSVCDDRALWLISFAYFSVDAYSLLVATLN